MTVALLFVASALAGAEARLTADLDGQGARTPAGSFACDSAAAGRKFRGTGARRNR
jgi:hypothetical protein